MTRTQKIFAMAATAAASILSAGAALAQEATPDTWQQVQTVKSRADVSAELFAARKSGLTRSWSAGYMEPVRTQALRAEVRAHTLQAIDSGEAKAINAEVYSFIPATALTLAAK
jgi:hypothetical protein